LVAKGFSQKEGFFLWRNLSPIAKWNTIRVMLALVAQNGWKVHQMDVRISFLNDDLQEDVYMTQRICFEFPGKGRNVWKLVNALYGLKQAPRAWYARMDAYLQKVSFLWSEWDETLYVWI
jgi:hypothetical protein